MDIKTQRRERVTETISDIRALLSDAAPDRAKLKQISERLQSLAKHEELFPVEEFAAPTAESGQSSQRYMLSVEPDESLALYVNVINPGKTTAPHNHGTWAVIVAIEGQELNRIYERQDDGSNPEYAKLAKVREYTVQRGSPIEFLPDDIHSIHVDGTQTVRHFHLYGRALEALSGRLGFDLETGKVSNYNRTYMRPTVGRDF